MTELRRIFTIGHSRHPIERFAALLTEHAIALVVDARSRPFSRFNPHFNRERLARALADAGIGYAWRGAALGGRPEDPAFHLPDGALDLDALWRWPALVEALDEVATEARARPVALLCAEEDPTHCHRRTLLTPPMRARGFEVLHIRGDGRIESEDDLHDPQPDLFGPTPRRHR
jgi:uncharacterized protein (DUF488 family)